MPPVSDEAKNRLCVNVFELTGCKLDVDDPVVVAAFFFSEQMRAVGAANLKATDELLLESEQRFARRTQVVAEKLEALFVKHLAAARMEMRDVAVSSLTQAIPVVRADLEKLVQQASQSSPNSYRKQSPRSSSRAMLGCGLLIAAASFVAGTLWTRSPTEKIAASKMAAGTSPATVAVKTTGIPDSTQDSNQVRNARPNVR